MRKVYVEAEVEVPVTVRVKASLIVRADDGADVHKAVESWAKGKRYSKADVEPNESEIVAVDGIDHSDDYTTADDWLTEAVEAKLDNGGCKLVDLLHDKSCRSYVSCMVVHRDHVIEATRMLRLSRLRCVPSIFRNLTGITVAVFDLLLQQLLPAFAAQRRRRLDRPDRQRAFGGGDDFDLEPDDQFLLTIFWLRHYPTQEVLGYLFGVSDSTAKRAIDRCLPLLEAAGQDTMRMPDPGRGRRKDLSALLKDTPDVAVIIDTFEQPVQRPQKRQKRFYSGKKKRHTLKSQVAVDEETGAIVDVADSVPGPTADIKVLKKSKLLKRLPQGVAGLGDLAYVGIADLHPEGLGATGRRKPRGQPRSLADRRYNKAFSRRRIVVEHGIGRLRRYQALAHTDRHFRKGHSARVRAVAGLVNRMLQQKPAA